MTRVVSSRGQSLFSDCPCGRPERTRRGVRGIARNYPKPQTELPILRKSGTAQIGAGTYLPPNKAVELDIGHTANFSAARYETPTANLMAEGVTKSAYRSGNMMAAMRGKNERTSMAVDEAEATDQLDTKRLLEAVSIFTALSFPISALVHSIVFMTWGMDFTTIASAEDVIMGGFRLLWLMVIISWSWVMLFVAHFLDNTQHIVSKSWKWKIASWIRAIASLSIALGGISLAVYMRYTGVAAELSLSRQILPFTAILITAYAVVIFFTTTLTISDAIIIIKQRRWMIAGLSLIISTLTMGYGMARAPTNWQIFNEEQLPEICQSRADHRHVLWWTGSRSSVIQCGSRIFVVLHSERSLIFERRLRRLPQI
jgi:hypothetical protein